MATAIDEFPEPADETDPRGDIPEAASPRRRLGVGAAIILILGALAVTVVIGVVRAGAGSASTPAVSVTQPAAAPTSGTQKRVYVDVAGAVNRPGLFVLPRDARVLDAISAAGGFSAKAARGSVNLARPVTDGEQLVVPEAGATPSPTADAASTAAAGGESSGAPAAGGKVSLNTATKEQLEELPRIGPALAQRILQWRKDNGRFTSVDDLRAVPGIGDKMLAALRDLVTI